MLASTKIESVPKCIQLLQKDNIFSLDPSEVPSILIAWNFMHIFNHPLPRCEIWNVNWKCIKRECDQKEEAEIIAKKPWRYDCYNKDLQCCTFELTKMGLFELLRATIYWSFQRVHVWNVNQGVLLWIK